MLQASQRLLGRTPASSSAERVLSRRSGLRRSHTAVTYAAPTPVGEHIAPACAENAATAPVIEYVASAPVIEYVDYAPIDCDKAGVQSRTRYHSFVRGRILDTMYSKNQRRMLIGRFRREDEIAGLSEVSSLLSEGNPWSIISRARNSYIDTHLLWITIISQH